MSLLKKAKKVERLPGRRVCVYGDAGIGKSTFAVSAPKPFVFDFNGDLEDLPQTFVAAPVTSLHEFMATLDDKGLGEFESIVIDKLDGLVKMLERDVLEAEGKASLAKIGFGKGPIFVADRLGPILVKLNQVRRAHGCHIILVADAKENKVEPPADDPFTQYGLAIDPKRCAPLIYGWLSELFFAHYKMNVIQEENRKSGRVTGGRDRVLLTGGTLSAVVKRRIEMPDEIPLSWAEYEKCFKKEVSSGAP